jgi:hypothetical protein
VLVLLVKKYAFNPVKGLMPRYAPLPAGKKQLPIINNEEVITGGIKPITAGAVCKEFITESYPRGGGGKHIRARCSTFTECAGENR